MTPFAPTDADLARIDRARAEAWLAAQGWEALPGLLPERAGCWWWLERGPEFGGEHHSVTVPADGVGDAARRWREVLHEAAGAHNLRGLALWSLLVQWQTPEPADG